MKDDDLEKMLNFIEKQRWKYPFKIDKTTRIEKDLKITDDDSVEFIIAFGKQFNVDVSNFMLTEYFEPEGDKILPAIKRIFSGQRKDKDKELLIGDLLNAIKTGKLV